MHKHTTNYKDVKLNVATCRQQTTNCQGKLNFNFGLINYVKFTVYILTLLRTKYMYSIKPWRQENLSKLSEMQLSGLLFHNVVIALFELQSSYSAYM